MLVFFQSLVTLPEPIQVAIGVGVTLVLGLAFNFLASKWPALAEWLGQYKDEAAFALAGAIVTYLNGLLAQIPLSWEGVANAALYLIVAVLAALGVIAQVRKFRKFRAQAG